MPRELHESPACDHVLEQQREVRRARTDRLDDAQQAAQHRERLGERRHLLQQLAQQRIQAPAPVLVHAPRQRRAAQVLQQLRGNGRVRHAQRRQPRFEFAARLLAVEPADDGHGARGRAAVGLHQRGKVRRHALAMPLQGRGELVPAATIHRQRDALAHGRVGGQRVGLLVLVHLQAVFQPPQEFVGGAELRRHGRRQHAVAGQARQRLQQRATLQPPLAAAAQQLERLHDEFDLADAAGAELDVVLQLAPRDLALDQRLHAAERFEHAEIQVTAIHERTHARAVDAVVERRARHRARLDPGVALPVAPLPLEVILEGRGARHQRSAGAERPQAHVDAESAALHGRRVQIADQQLSEPQEELLVRQRPLTRGLAVRREQEDQVDVRGEIELLPAELAHGDDDEPLCLRDHPTAAPRAARPAAARHIRAPRGWLRRQRCSGRAVFPAGSPSRPGPARRCAPAPRAASGAARP